MCALSVPATAHQQSETACRALQAGACRGAARPNFDALTACAALIISTAPAAINNDNEKDNATTADRVAVPSSKQSMLGVPLRSGFVAGLVLTGAGVEDSTTSESH